MIIKRLTLNNFGVYAGSNTLLFNSEKPIVLIGGMNGRGKTTFLEAVLLALYGSNSPAFLESKQKSYSQYLRSFVNWNQLDQDCSIEMEFEINNSTKENYVIFREWNMRGQRSKEKVRVFKNGEFSKFLTDNWPMFVENILPSALSSFFFFDGEKIAELAIDSSNAQLKNAIRSMLGISVLDVLSVDLVRNLRKAEKKSAQNKTATEVKRLRKEKETAEKELENIEAEIAVLQKKMEKDQDQLELLRQSYSSKGGIAVEQRQELIMNKVSLGAELENIKSRILELAANELPLLLVADLVKTVNTEAQDEHKEAVLSEALMWMDEFHEEFIQHYDTNSTGQSNAFLNFVKKKISIEQKSPVYELSDQALLQVNHLVEVTMKDTAFELRDLLQKKGKLDNKINEMEGYLTLDINEEELSGIQEEIKLTEQELIEDKVALSKLEIQRREINGKVISATSEFNRYVEAYLSDAEQMDSTERIIKYSNLALQIIEKYTIELQKQKIGMLAETITDCYRSLASKKNMISHIVMDSNTLDLTYIADDGSEVPKDSLSAGEKQLMVVSVLWALAICSKKKLPTIIDTPLSRLDSTHRTSLITTYFPNAGEQTIILSTDSEIDAGYYALMKENVGDEYTLIYNDQTKSTFIKRGYLIGD